MLDLKRIRENPGELKKALADRQVTDVDVDELLAVDEQWRNDLQEMEQLRARKNEVSREIGELKRQGEDAQDLIDEMREVNDRLGGLEDAVASAEQQLEQRLLEIPNIPDESVPVGADEDDNLEIKRVGEPPVFDFEPRAHWALGEELGILDPGRGAKIAGSSFPLYMGAGARLERALINFMLDLHTGEHGYTETLPPFLANAESMTGTAQLPKFEHDMFKEADQGLYLVPTGEVPVTNIHREEILEPEELPKRYCAYTPCFRKEAGAAGRDTRGLIRVHQFNKVELVHVCRQEDSWDEHERLLAAAEEVLKRLELPYRVVTLCTGDLTFASAKTYDIEVWLPGYDRYREISSVSNFLDYQARRANIQYRPAPGEKAQYAHTLNGSGLAIGRTVAAVLENYQNADGSVTIPEVLRPYMGGLEAIEPAATHADDVASAGEFV